MNMVRHHKEEKAAKEEKKRKRSPFAQQRANEAELESMESLMEDKALEGDGSGEVALDTLTPTHTYAKAGRYVVKCKGVTGIARTHTSILKTNYYPTLKYVELNNEVTTKTKIVTAYGTNLINSLSAKLKPSKKLGMMYKAPNNNEPKILNDGFQTLKITKATAIHP